MTVPLSDNASAKTGQSGAGKERCPQCGVWRTQADEMPCPGCLMKLGMPNPSATRPQGGSGPFESSELPLTRSLSGDFDQNPSSDDHLSRIIEAQFPNLEIEELLGEGGMGMVFKARQTSLDRVVALKVIKASAERQAAFESRFTREARALASLNHPNIVTVFDFGKSGEYFFLIMEYVDGVNVRDLLVDQQITPREALEIVPQVCEALQYAHDQGVVHRDIKPENILLDRNGRVKIADFGLAKLVKPDQSNPTLTREHHVMGTPHYMAPEQVEKPLSVDHRADIYSLGVVIYEMLTGELPLGRFAPPSRKVEVDSRLDEIVLHSLEKEPALRYQKVSEVKTDFESLHHKPRPADPAPFAGHSPEVRQLHGRNIGAQKPIQPTSASAVPSARAAGDTSPSMRHSPPTVAKAALAQKPKADFGNPYDDAHWTDPGGKPGSAGGRFGLGALFAPRTYASAAYLLLSFPLGLLLFLTSVLSLSLGPPLTIIWVGFVIWWGLFLILKWALFTERQLCRWLLFERIPFSPNRRFHASRWERCKGMLSDPFLWRGILYSMIKLPWSIFCFGIFVAVFLVPLSLFAAPILISFWLLEIQIGDFEVDSFGKAVLVSLLGLPLLWVSAWVINGLAWISGKMARFFLSSN